MQSGSTIAGALAWLFLVWQFLLSMAAPAWLEMLTFCGFVLSALASLILSWVERKRNPKSKRLGLWLGISALTAFAFFFVVLPSM
jgi:ABC-type Fe3+-siderophore transport system permease subunit